MVFLVRFPRTFSSYVFLAFQFFSHLPADSSEDALYLFGVLDEFGSEESLEPVSEAQISSITSGEGDRALFPQLLLLIVGEPHLLGVGQRGVLTGEAHRC